MSTKEEILRAKKKGLRLGSLITAGIVAMSGAGWGLNRLAEAQAAADAAERSALAEKFDLPSTLPQAQKDVLNGLRDTDLRNLRDVYSEVTGWSKSFGASCSEDDSTTDGAGFSGTNTSISYGVVYNGQKGRACVAHFDGGAQGHATSFYPEPPVDTPTLRPAEGAARIIAQLPPAQRAVVDALVISDLGKLTTRYESATASKLPIGANCIEGKGTTIGTGFNGTATSIAYDVTSNGERGHVCVSHYGQGGIHGHGTNFFPAAR
jgi:hypothetical protein